MNNLINIFEEHQADSDFIAECVYAYLSEHCPYDGKFIADLIRFLEGENK